MERKADTYMRYILQKDAEKRAEHLARLADVKQKPPAGAWKDRPLSARRKAVPITGRVDPGAIDATKKRATRIFKLRQQSIQEVVDKLREKGK